jgi:DNA-binding transcriptional LysR family regulator
MQTIVSLVSAGMGLALVPQSVSNLMRPGVEYRALADPTPLVETGTRLAPRQSPSPVLQGFLELLKEFLNMLSTRMPDPSPFPSARCPCTGTA